MSSSAGKNRVQCKNQSAPRRNSPYVSALWSYLVGGDSYLNRARDVRGGAPNHRKEQATIAAGEAPYRLTRSEKGLPIEGSLQRENDAVLCREKRCGKGRAAGLTRDCPSYLLAQGTQGA